MFCFVLQFGKFSKCRGLLVKVQFTVYQLQDAKKEVENQRLVLLENV